uniref:F-box domain-containing protein n=1 Tax=Spongospora subterranea TaxID=70186 RepID=A0A0H5QX26_9EUKA|eukprot:CRZ06276.1 hypothetical protein [Spongospora subterranea]
MRVGNPVKDLRVPPFRNRDFHICQDRSGIRAKCQDRSRINIMRILMRGSAVEEMGLSCEKPMIRSLRWLFCTDSSTKDDRNQEGEGYEQDHFYLNDIVRRVLQCLGPSRDLARISPVCRSWNLAAKKIMDTREVIVVAEGSSNGTINVFDPLSQRWGFIHPYPGTQWLATLNKRLIAIGIGTCAEYDPVNRRWISLPSCNALDRFLIGCVLNDHCLIVIAGYERGQTIVMQFDNRLRQWSELTRLHMDICLASVGVIASQNQQILLLVGGDDDGRLVDLSLTLDPVNGSWKSLPRQPDGPHFPGGFVVWNNRLVIAGGWVRALREATTDMCCVFDIDTLQWTSLPSIPATNVMGLTVVNDKLVALVDDSDESIPSLQSRLIFFDGKTWKKEIHVPSNDMGASDDRFQGRVRTLLGISKSSIGQSFLCRKSAAGHV